LNTKKETKSYLIANLKIKDDNNITEKNSHTDPYINYQQPLRSLDNVISTLF